MKYRTRWTDINVVGMQDHDALSKAAQPFPFVPLGETMPQQDILPDFEPFTGRKKEPEIIYRGFSEDEVQAARNAGYKEGLEAGELRGREEGKGERFAIDGELSKSLMQLEVQLTTLFQEYRNFCSRAMADAQRLAFAIARKVAGEALTENAEAGIRGMVESCFGFITSEPEVRIRVHPSQVEPLEQHLKQRARLEPFAGNVHVIGDEVIAPTDYEIEWNDGGASLHAAERWAEVEAALAAFVPPSPENQVLESDEAK